MSLQSRASFKGVIKGVALSVEENQLKLKLPGVCDFRRLVRSRSVGERGEMEKTLSVLLSFDVFSRQGQVRTC